jgi:peroxiredoxin
MAAIDFVLPDVSELRGAKLNHTVTQLALKIRTFTGCAEKAVLMSELADQAPDTSDDALQEVTTTLSEALKGCRGMSDSAYRQLARLIRYAGMRASLDDPRLVAAIAKLEAEDRDIQEADFTLADLQGKTWKLTDLRGKVVLLNFWSTGCPPCVDEIPTMNALYRQFEKQGLIILAISYDDPATATRFLKDHSVPYPVLLDPERKVIDKFHVEGIPRSVVYDRTGKLTTQAIGERTHKQLAEALGKAGLH